MSSVGRQILPICLLLTVFSAFAVLLISHAAKQQNLTASYANQHIAETALRHMMEGPAIYAAEYTYWDDAAEYSIVNHDMDWVSDNVTDWAVDSLGMDGALIFGAGNRLIQAAAPDYMNRFSIPDALSPQMIDLIQAARAKGPAYGLPEEITTGMFKDETGTHIAGATVFAWEDEDAGLPLDGDTPVVLLYYRTMNEALLSDIGSRFLLEGLALVPAGSGELNGRLPVQTAGGEVLGDLVWHFELPGDKMVDRMKAPFVLGLVVLAVVFWYFLRRAARAAQVVKAFQTSLQDQAEDLLQAKNEAVAANREKSKFLAMMSHEIRTPLNAIIGFSDLMRQDDFKNLPAEKYQNYAKDIYRSGHYLLSLINDVLDMSKIEAQRYELFEDVVTLDEIVADSLKLVAGSADNKRLRLTAVPSDTVVFADSRAIKQILVNLLTNAVKFSTEGSEVRIEVASDQSDHLDINVIDHGIGMSRDDVEKALSAFGQTRASYSANTQGTGLGLNICRALVELHGGSLLLDSEPGRGTTVTVRLPRSRLVSAPSDRLTA